MEARYAALPAISRLSLCVERCMQWRDQSWGTLLLGWCSWCLQLSQKSPLTGLQTPDTPYTPVNVPRRSYHTVREIATLISVLPYYVYYHKSPNPAEQCMFAVDSLLSHCMLELCKSADYHSNSFVSIWITIVLLIPIRLLYFMLTVQQCFGKIVPCCWPLMVFLSSDV